MTIDGWEQVVHAGGFSLLLATWVYSGYGAFAGASQESGRSVGLARRLRAHTVYAITAIPYFAICFLLWRPLPLTPSDAGRIVLLVLGTVVGLSGAVLYLLGRRELGAMYNVSSSLGSELYAGHVLVTTGPYSLCRHPMYLGLAFAAVGGLMVYRTWTLVFMCLTLVGAAFKATSEERLLKAEFGALWERYAGDVPAWIPHIHRREKEMRHVNATT